MHTRQGERGRKYKLLAGEDIFINNTDYTTHMHEYKFLNK